MSDVNWHPETSAPRPSPAPGEPFWVTSTPNVPRVWSASSISTIADCPRRFELAYVEGWSKRGLNVPATFGRLFHEGAAERDRLIAAKVDPEEALRQVVRWALGMGDLLPPGFDNSRTPKTLARALVFYADYWADDPSTLLEVEGEPAIEVEFRTIIPGLTNADGEPYQLRGYLDELRTMLGENYVWERKTTARSLDDYYFSRFSPDTQLGIYTIAAMVHSKATFAGVVLDGVQTLVSDTRFKRRWFKFDESQLEEIWLNIRHAIRDAERYAEANYWPQNTKACLLCDFKSVCAVRPEARLVTLEADFEEKRRTTVESHK